MCCPVCRKSHIKDPLLLFRKSRLCDDSTFPLKKYVTMTLWEPMMWKLMCSRGVVKENKLSFEVKTCKITYITSGIPASPMSVRNDNYSRRIKAITWDWVKNVTLPLLLHCTGDGLCCARLGAPRVVDANEALLHPVCHPAHLNLHTRRGSPPGE